MNPQKDHFHARLNPSGLAFSSRRGRLFRSVPFVRYFAYHRWAAALSFSSLWPRRAGKRRLRAGVPLGRFLKPAGRAFVVMLFEVAVRAASPSLRLVSLRLHGQQTSQSY